MPFLRSQGQPIADDLIRHIEHAIDVCGEDHVGMWASARTARPRRLWSRRSTRSHFADEIKERRKQGISAPGEDPNVYLFYPILTAQTGFFVSPIC